MNCKTANNLNIIEILANYNVHPRIQSKQEARCLSPFRNETEPSFHINTSKNVWYDFGEDIGGTVVDLIMKLHNCSIAGALEILREKSFSFSQQNRAISNLEPSFNIQKICKIQKPGLISYLHSRKIDVSIAKTYCKEIHHSYNTLTTYSNNITKQQYDNAAKSYYAIALLNDKDGYEIRNKYFKGCVGSKAITTINNNSTTVNTFEGFTDFLSYITIYPESQKENFIITNSTALIEKSLDYFSKYEKIKSFFDNDQSGRKATKILINSCGSKVEDCSSYYRDYKDMNQFLMAR